MFSAIVVILLKCYKCKGCVFKEASSKLKSSNRSSSLEKKCAGLQGLKWITVHEF